MNTSPVESGGPKYPIPAPNSTNGKSKDRILTAAEKIFLMV